MAFIHLGADKIDVTMVECTCIPNKKMVPRLSHECQLYRFMIPLSLWYLKAMYIPMIPKPKASKCREKCTFFVLFVSGKDFVSNDCCSQNKSIFQNP